MAERCIEKYFNMNAGQYCGVLMKEPMSKKIAKLLYKQNQEIQELLASDLSQVEISNWTLAYPNGEQTIINYFETDTNDEKLKRIKLFDKSSQIKFCKNVYHTDKKYNAASEDVKDTFEKEGV